MKNVLLPSLVIVLFWAGLYLPYLGDFELRGEEARRILPARAMLDQGGWLTPQIGGRDYDRKPPGINWAIAASFQAVGKQNEFAARLPSAVGLLVFALGGFLLLRRPMGWLWAMMVPLFCLTTVAVMEKGRLAEIEALYLAMTGLGFLAWARAWADNRPWLAYTFPFLILGLAFFLKGPIHLLFFYPILIGAHVISGETRRLFHPAHAIGLFLILLPSLPWMLANLHPSGGEAGAATSSAKPGDAAASVWLQKMLVRLWPESIDWVNWLTRPFKLFVNFLPWSPLLAWLWWRDRALLAAGDTTDRWSLLLRASLGGTLVGSAFILIPPATVARYALPLFPVAAFALAVLLQRQDWEHQSALVRRWTLTNRVVSMVGVGLALIVLSLGFTDLADLAAPSTAWPTVVVAALTLAVAWHPRIAGGRIQGGAPLAPLVSLLVILSLNFTAYTHYPAIRKGREVIRPCATELLALTEDTNRLIVFYRPKFLRFTFYIDRPYHEADLVADLPKEACYLVLPEEDLSQDKVQRYLSRFTSQEDLGTHLWEERQFRVLALEP